jgi:hypothetical protein
MIDAGQDRQDGTVGREQQEHDSNGRRRPAGTKTRTARTGKPEEYTSLCPSILLLS